MHTNLHGVYEAFGDDEALVPGERALDLYRMIGYRRAETFGQMSDDRSLARPSLPVRPAPRPDDGWG